MAQIQAHKKGSGWEVTGDGRCFEIIGWECVGGLSSATPQQSSSPHHPSLSSSSSSSSSCDDCCSCSGDGFIFEDGAFLVEGGAFITCG